MNVQVEHQPDHTARLTVQIDDATFSKAREKAARALSNKVNIPGFRKGKVPLRILINYLGEESILNEAIDQMSQDVYREALKESGITPYGPGSFEDVVTDTLPPTLIYSVPKEPTVDLGDYRAIRLPYEAELATDADLDQAMRMLQQEQALSEPSSRPAVMGNRIRGALHSYFVEAGDTAEAVPYGNMPQTAEEEAAALAAESAALLARSEELKAEAAALPDSSPELTIEAETLATEAAMLADAAAEIAAEGDGLDDEDADASLELAQAMDELDAVDDLDDFEDEDEDDDHGHSVIDAYMSSDQEVYLHEHEFTFVLDPENEPAPGFSEAVVGVNQGETRQFVLALPTKEQDESVAEAMAGRSVRFILHVDQVESITLPELTDDFAARLTKDEENPLSLLELRIRMRQNLDAERARQYNSDYVTRALNLLIDGATMAYPDAMVEDHVHRLLEDFDQRLRRSGLTLADYQNINNKTHEDLHVDFHDPAVRSVKRALAMQGLIDAEKITVDEALVRQEMLRFVAQFQGEMQDRVMQQFIQDPDMLMSVRSSLLQEAVNQRLIAIAKGEAPALEEEAPALEAAPESSSDGQAEAPAPTDTPQSAVTSANEES